MVYKEWPQGSWMSTLIKNLNAAWGQLIIK